jgi:hypothetical protein
MPHLLALTTGEIATIAGAVLSVVWLLFLLIGFWRVFTKLGLPGWMGLIPFLNVFMIFRARGQHEPVLWLVLTLIPCVQVVGFWVLASDTAELFGKGFGWKLFLFLIPGLSHLALGYGGSTVDRTALAPGVGLNG